MDVERLTEALKWAGPSDSEEEDIFDAARELVDAPRMWWCTGVVFSYRPDDCPEDSNHHRACCWVRLVKEDN